MKASQNKLVREITNSHYNRVVADGGVIDSKELLSLTIDQLLKLYPSGNFSILKSKLPVTLSAKIFGYKIGAGSGVTLGGFACEKLYSLDSANDAVQSTVANQPLLLRHTGTNYLYSARTGSSGVTGNHTMAYTSSTDTLVLTAQIFMNNQSAASSYDYVIQCSTAAILSLTNNGTSKILRFRGTANAASSSAYTPSTSVPHWIRLTSTTTQIIYEWSADGTAWTNIGTTTRPAVGTIGTTCGIGSTGLNVANSKNIYYAHIQNITTGAEVIFNPADYNSFFAQTGWTKGNAIWSIVTDTAVTGLKCLLVDQTTVMGNGTSMKLSVSSLTLTQPTTIYTIVKRLGTGVVVGMAAGSQISNDGTNTILNNGTAVNISNNVRLRQLVTSVSNGVSSSIQIEKVAVTSGNGGSNNGTYLDLFANATAFGNYTIETVLISSAIDNSAQKTALYNILSVNNVQTVAITGDSIAFRLHPNGLQNLVLNCKRTYLNAAISGSNLAKITVNDPSTWNPLSFIERSKVGSPNIIDISNVNTLLVWAGFNDMNDDVPLGTLTDTDEFTIAGAIRNGIANYLSRKPTLQILFMNPSANPYQTTNGIGISLPQYAAHIKAVCENINIPCYDMHANCGIDLTNYVAVLPDQIHPINSYLDNPISYLVTDFIKNS